MPDAMVNVMEWIVEFILLPALVVIGLATVVAPFAAFYLWLVQ